MRRKAKSKAWMRAHVSDAYVQRAVAQGYRSRAAFKLIEIDDRDRLITPGMRVVDLGAAPGGWSQVIVERLGGKGAAIALDLLPMQPIPGVVVIQGDFRDPGVLARLEEALGAMEADLVVSDMAPNISGVAASDQARVAELAQSALEFARERLRPRGALLVKVFQGAGFSEFLARMRGAFVSVAARKPGASRGSSAETYLLGRHLRQEVRDSGPRTRSRRR